MKEIIQFRNKGDPASLLRVINPIEAKLLDSSIGAHVRFRLGGTGWPPQIYYKIFLHSPVCDVNSYAPRNYADKKSKEITLLSQDQLDEYAEKFGWYHRVENNGWRPISSLSPTAIDSITHLTNKSKSHKNFKKRFKKTKNIKDEIVKMKLKRVMEEQGKPTPTKTDEFDDNGILEWAENIDIQNYINDWETLGTTGPSSDLWWNNNNMDISDDESSDSSDSELDEDELLKLIS
ncbi:IQ calmodulin-binding motif family protein [Histomonas meleagridis]|uniref:IQ calmodulin-binding motif family protein n=1 Tax=Histomonas meleagridis TaxID=135588 RepID=UPI00355A774E|nr:IQ calmodulin-binding motif family protein [Histomonas meleagridis]KAH0800215.1 IQ calmodulin-binding motif family protein [Histomonas meleagridis]